MGARWLLQPSIRARWPKRAARAVHGAEAPCRRAPISRWSATLLEMKRSRHRCPRRRQAGHRLPDKGRAISGWRLAADPRVLTSLRQLLRQGRAEGTFSWTPAVLVERLVLGGVGRDHVVAVENDGAVAQPLVAIRLNASVHHPAPLGDPSVALESELREQVFGSGVEISAALGFATLDLLRVGLDKPAAGFLDLS
jgi:hypothetical protein